MRNAGTSETKTNVKRSNVKQSRARTPGGVGVPPRARSEVMVAGEKLKATRGKQATKGRGRPSEIENMEVVTLRMPGELVAAVDAVVKRSRHVYRDRSQFIRQMVALAMLADKPVKDYDAERGEVVGKRLAEIAAMKSRKRPDKSPGRAVTLHQNARVAKRK